jgi:hypothetical protein
MTSCGPGTWSGSAGRGTTSRWSRRTSLFSGRTTVAAWRNKPTWYAISTRDKTASPELERFRANGMKATTVGFNTSHLSIVT